MSSTLVGSSVSTSARGLPRLAGRVFFFLEKVACESLAVRRAVEECFTDSRKEELYWFSARNLACDKSKILLLAKSGLN